MMTLLEAPVELQSITGADTGSNSDSIESSYSRYLTDVSTTNPTALRSRVRESLHSDLNLTPGSIVRIPNDSTEQAIASNNISTTTNGFSASNSNLSQSPLSSYRDSKSSRKSSSFKTKRRHISKSGSLLVCHDEVTIRFQDPKLHQTVSRTYSTQKVEYIEELIHDILSEMGVTPVYRMLFGLKFIDEDIWLAPNCKLHDLSKSKSGCHEMIFDLKVRFRPSFINRIHSVDPMALDLIFAQIRDDFINLRFENHHRSFVIFNGTVSKMIASDVMRSAKELDQDLDSFIKSANMKDFTPRFPPSWQISAFIVNDWLKLKESLLRAFGHNCEQDSKYFKSRYIELFTSQDICEFYGSETYKVDDCRNKFDEIRVRYSEHTSPYCLIEVLCKVTKGVLKSFPKVWTKLCELGDISNAELNDTHVVINGFGKDPILSCDFKSNLHARSFLSLVDGYYRLMRRWHMSICDQISSPELRRLLELKSHGPICYDSMACKLLESMRTGTYLIRISPKLHNHYYIDTLLPSRARLLIDIKWDPGLKKFFKINHDCSVDRDNPMVNLNENGYNDLAALISDTQVILREDSGIYPPQQLIECLRPNEFDDFPDLLVCIPKKQMFELERRKLVYQFKDTDLPKLIPLKIIMIKDCPINYSGNGISTKLAYLNGDRLVIVKSPMVDDNFSARKRVILNLNQRNWISNGILGALSPVQMRLTDWAFVKHPLFAETVGIIPCQGSPMVQEHLSGNRLDEYISKLSFEPNNHKHPSALPIIEKIANLLASALLFLQERHITHGKLRCHNIFVKATGPIDIKITDPLGTYDVDKDRSFIPPEYFEFGGAINLPEYDQSFDIWAFGTTLWQLFNKGSYPPEGTYANMLMQPPNCPSRVWSTIESCWIVNRSLRVTAQRIHQEIHDHSSWGNDYEMLPDYGASEAYNDRPIFGPIRKLIANLTSSWKSSQVDSNGTQYCPLKSISSTTQNSSLETSYNSEDPITVADPQKSSCIINGNIAQNNINDLHILDELMAADNGTDNESIVSVECRTTFALINSQNLKLGPEIGRGSSGSVHKASLQRPNGLTNVAVKILEGLEIPGDLIREFDILRKLSHKNIIKTLGMVQEGQSVSLVMEFMQLGNLLSFVRLHKDRLSSLPIVSYSLQIAQGMEYLERMKIIHRDLALRNILLKNHEEIKICDFGLAQSLGSNLQYTLKTDRPLPLRWCAPEVLETWTFSHLSDVWSYGIVLWELFSGGCCPQYPGSYLTLKEVLKTERLKRPRNCPIKIYELMLSCWAYEPTDRPNFSRIYDMLKIIDDFGIPLEEDSNRAA